MSLAVAMVAGPALGHIARLLSVALRLRNEGVDVRFYMPSTTSNADLPRSEGFETHEIAVAPSMEGEEAIVERASTFAAGLEAALIDRTADVLVQDFNPVLWGPVIRWPNVPRVVVTNSFLMAPKGQSALLAGQFRTIERTVAERRAAKGLRPLESHLDLYRGDEVCLADPTPIVEAAGGPDQAVGCGACFYEIDGRLPGDLAATCGHAVISMGSTGRAFIGQPLLDAIATSFDVDGFVYAGPDASRVGALRSVRHAARRLPLAPLLAGARVALVQGGAGSTYQALSHGVPVIVLPDHANQRTLGDLVQQLGAGLCLPIGDEIGTMERANPQRLREGAARLAKVMVAEDGPGAVARRIRSLAASNIVVPVSAS